LLGLAASEETLLDIRDNIDQVREAITRAARRAGRQAASIKLMAVTKRVEAERVKVALAHGICCIGENKVQEAMEKRGQLEGHDFEFHFIGTLQKNKVNKAVPLFDWIDSVDSLEVARKIDQGCATLGKVMPVLLQVNLGREETKSGAAEEEWLALAGQVAGFQHLSVRGLMAIPPFREDPEAVRPYFRRLRLLADKFRQLGLPRLAMDELSMGMSHDFPVAIEEGATIIRVGTAIFGERQYV
jgi:pyridoxal phosphate enzyme (YggS family)